MFENRRQFIKQLFSLTIYGLSITNGLINTALANIQWQQDNFKAADYSETLIDLFQGTEFIESPKIKVRRLPRVAENGAIVPIKISSSLENVTKISILVEKNPHPLIAEFYFSPAVETSVSARIKMAKSSNVIIIVEADEKLYRKKKYVKVIKGGCGG